MGVWDKTTPLGTDAKSQGDDRIRELKDALEEALSHEYSTFPGASPSTTPIFIPGFLKGATANRPTGDSLVEGRLYINSEDGTIERYNGASWDIVFTHPANGAIGTAKLDADAVTGAKIADDAINSEHYVDGSIDNVHLSADCVNGAKIADDAIDSEHYVDGSIDAAHLAANIVGTGKLNTATGSSSGSGGSYVNVQMNDYCFYPSKATWNANDAVSTWTNGSGDPGDTVGRFQKGNTQSYAIRWRYVTASDRPRIWILMENGKITSIWESEDPPNQTDYEADDDPFNVGCMPDFCTSIKVPIIDRLETDRLLKSFHNGHREKMVKEMAKLVNSKPWPFKLNGVKHHGEILEVIPKNLINMGNLFYFRSIFPKKTPSLVMFKLLEYSPYDRRLVLKKNFQDEIEKI